MRAADTNVIVRLIIRDEDKQVAAMERYIEKGVWLSHLVVVETAWVLRVAYGFSHSEIAGALEMVLDEQHVTIQETDVVRAALELYRQRPSLGFSDCMILEIARKAGHLPLGTFDKTFGRVEGAELL